jgi:hypothetical protein
MWLFSESYAAAYGVESRGERQRQAAAVMRACQFDQDSKLRSLTNSSIKSKKVGLNGLAVLIRFNSYRVSFCICIGVSRKPQ